MFVDPTHETDGGGRGDAAIVAAMTQDERLVEDLYNRAVLHVYEPWTHEASWLSRAESARAAYAVGLARRNLSALAECHANNRASQRLATIRSES